jgi:hypothetical protein
LAEARWLMGCRADEHCSVGTLQSSSGSARQTGAYRRATIFLGLDWAEESYDITLVNCDGAVLGQLQVGDTMASVTQIHELVGGTSVIPVKWWWVPSRSTVWSGKHWPPTATRSTRSIRRPPADIGTDITCLGRSLTSYPGAISQASWT